MPPDQFIPLAEENGLIVQIGQWVLREVCREAGSWPRPLQVAVNLSPVQFHSSDLEGSIHQILLETGHTPTRLEIEITEGVPMGDFTGALNLLRRLKALGIRIAMDEFGTGYSSLSYLQSFPSDKIKIDRSFISNLEATPPSAEIVRMVLSLAHALKSRSLPKGWRRKRSVPWCGRSERQSILVWNFGSDIHLLITEPRRGALWAQQIFCTTAISLTQIGAISFANAREGLMENVRRYRALASLCRQQAAYRPLQNWELLGQAEHFEYLAEVELKAHFDACNGQHDEGAAAPATWETPVAA